MRSYLSERRVVVSLEHSSVSKGVTKGCPQGSILGPLLWDVNMSELLEKLERESIFIIAFADDLLVLVDGDSRRDLSFKSQVAINHMLDWCEKAKMRLSPSKTVAMMMRGRFHTERPPQIRIRDSRLRVVQSTKYLGITISEGTRFYKHVQDVVERCRHYMSKLMGLSRAKWGLSSEACRTIYKGLAVPILSYGASTWFDRINARQKRSLTGAQRQALLACTKAYRTTPTKALQVLAKLPPIEMVIAQRSTLYWARTGRRISYGDLHWRENQYKKPLSKREALLAVHPADRVERHDIGANNAKQETAESLLKKATLRLWQRQWSASGASLTREFIPDIPTWLKSRFPINHETVQFMTGHGDFNAYLYRFGLHSSPLCDCGALEDVKHTLYDCSFYKQYREEWSRSLGTNGLDIRKLPETITNKCASETHTFLRQIQAYKTEKRDNAARTQD